MTAVVKVAVRIVIISVMVTAAAMVAVTVVVMAAVARAPRRKCCPFMPQKTHVSQPNFFD